MGRFVKMAVMLTTVMSIVSTYDIRADDRVETVSFKTLISRNLVNLNKLSIGMTKTEVLELMGSFAAETKDSLVPNPYKVEPFSLEKDQYEVLYYLTKKYPPFTPIKLSQATPVVLKNGRVVGWGTGALQKVKAGGFGKE